MGGDMMIRTDWLVCAGVLLTQSICAHPFLTEQLGRFSELTIHRDRVDVKYTLSLTRLLLIEEIVLMNRDGDTRISEEEKRTYYSSLRETLREGLSLTIDGQPVRIEVCPGIEVQPPVYRVFQFRGSFKSLLTGDHSIVFSDRNYPQVPGPVEIVGRASDGIAILSKADTDLSKIYQEPKSPDEAMGAFQVRELEIRFRVGDLGARAEGPPPAEEEMEKPASERDLRQVPGPPKSRIYLLADRVFQGEIVGAGGTVVVLCAFILIGALHALTPGHGKAIVAAYLVGSRGRVRDAIILGAVVTFTHTASVVVLVVVVHVLKNVFLPARLNPFIASASGLLILVMGICLIVSRVRRRGVHAHGHEHGADHHHRGDVTTGALLSLGVAGGIVPCPDALAVLLLAIGFNHFLLGLLLLFAFSFGLAAVLMAIGILLVTGRLKLMKGAEDSRLVKYYLPMASAVAIAILGAAMTIIPLVKSGILSVRINLPA
ncbi:MAG: hypothetical protein AB1696_13665 [Planctomycetota bacterium]